jgi:hypothetical protein
LGADLAEILHFSPALFAFLGDAAELSVPVGNTAAGKGKDYELEISDVLMPEDLEGKKQLSL